MPYVLPHAKNSTVNRTIAKLVRIATVEQLQQQRLVNRTVAKLVCIATVEQLQQ